MDFISLGWESYGLVESCDNAHEALGVERSATDETAVNVGLCKESASI